MSVPSPAHFVMGGIRRRAECRETRYGSSFCVPCPILEKRDCINEHNELAAKRTAK